MKCSCSKSKKLNRKIMFSALGRLLVDKQPIDAAEDVFKSFKFLHEMTNAYEESRLEEFARANNIRL